MAVLAPLAACDNESGFVPEAVSRALSVLADDLGPLPFALCGLLLLVWGLWACRDAPPPGEASTAPPGAYDPAMLEKTLGLVETNHYILCNLVDAVTQKNDLLLTFVTKRGHKIHLDPRCRYLDNEGGVASFNSLPILRATLAWLRARQKPALCTECAQEVRCTTEAPSGECGQSSDVGSECPPFS